MIRVDGQDIEQPEPGPPYRLACRAYTLEDGRISPLPSEAMVRRALRAAISSAQEGRWDTITDAGLNPKPVQRPIPIWIGGGPGSAGGTSPAGADRVLRRIARMADGWFPSVGLDTGIREAVATLHNYIRQEGRDVSAVRIEGSVTVANSTPQEWPRQASAWRELGATHISVNTAAAGFTSVDQHVNAMLRFKDAVSDAV